MISIKTVTLLAFALCYVFVWPTDSREISRPDVSFIFPFPKPKPQDDSELISLQFLFRHGDRTPIAVYPADPYANYSFPEGLGELTNKGKERLYKYGKVLAKRYEDYFENMFMRNVIAQSSPLRRCLETNEAALGGMFPPTRAQIWSRTPSWPELILAKIWQPIGVSTVEIARSWKINPDAPCPAASELDHAMVTDNPTLAKFLSENADFMAKVREYSRNQFPSWKFYGYLYDAIYSEQNYFEEKFIWPKWLDQVGPNTLAKLKEFNDLNFAIYGSAPERFLKLRTGTLLKEMIDNLKGAANQTQITKENRMVYTYSSHDTMIGYIMNLFGLYKAQPSFGSGLIYELRKPKSGPPMIHLYYANVTNHFDIYKLKLNESDRFRARCPNAECSIDNFQASIQEFLEVDVENDCKV